MPKHVEFRAGRIEVSNKNCVGCVDWDADVMLTVDQATKYLGSIGDKAVLFLSLEKAKNLIKDLQKAVEGKA